MNRSAQVRSAADGLDRSTRAQLAPIVVAARALRAARPHARAARAARCRRPGSRPSAAGWLVLVLALVSPIDSIGEERLFSVHMAQHLLIGDLAPLLARARPHRPAAAPAARGRGWLRRLRALTHPLVALPLWALNLLASGTCPLLYDAALAPRRSCTRSQHACFLTGGLLLWTTLLGLLPGPRWFGLGGALRRARRSSGSPARALANVFLWSDRAYYPPYVHAPRTWGLSPLADQRAGGGVMLLEMMLVGAVVFVVLGLDWLADAERRQRRLEARTS